MKTLRIILYSQIFLFFAWAGWLLASHADAREIWLETNPVDPRSLISGTYVALSYPMENPATFNSGGCPTQQRTVYVRLEKAYTVQTAKGDVQVYSATACSPVKGGDGVWARGIRSLYSGRFSYGINRFYLNEDSPLKNARGSLVAKVSVNSEGDMRLLELADKQ